MLLIEMGAVKALPIRYQVKLHFYFCCGGSSTSHGIIAHHQGSAVSQQYKEDHKYKWVSKQDIWEHK